MTLHVGLQLASSKVLPRPLRLSLRAHINGQSLRHLSLAQLLESLQHASSKLLPQLSFTCFSELVFNFRGFPISALQSLCPLALLPSWQTLALDALVFWPSNSAGTSCLLL